MEAIMSTVTSVFTTGLTMVGDLVETITASGNELLLLFTMIPIVGLGIGLFKRVIH